MREGRRARQRPPGRRASALPDAVLLRLRQRELPLPPGGFLPLRVRSVHEALLEPPRAACHAPQGAEGAREEVEEEEVVVGAVARHFAAPRRDLVRRIFIVPLLLQEGRGKEGRNNRAEVSGRVRRGEEKGGRAARGNSPSTQQTTTTCKKTARGATAAISQASISHQPIRTSSAAREASRGRCA